LNTIAIDIPRTAYLRLCQTVITDLVATGATEAYSDYAYGETLVTEACTNAGNIVVTTDFIEYITTCQEVIAYLASCSEGETLAYARGGYVIGANMLAEAQRNPIF